MNFCIIDDHLLLAEFIRSQLRKVYPDGTAKLYTSTDMLLMESFEKWKPDVVISDVLMPGMNGIDLIIKLKEKLPDTKFILLTSIADIAMVKLANKKGADGYLTKDCSEAELLEAIRVVHGGGKYVNASLKERLVSQIFGDELPELSLTPRENEILQLICLGKTPKEIAADLYLGLNTVQQYIKGIMKKFKVTRTTELVIFAIKKGLFNPGQG